MMKKGAGRGKLVEIRRFFNTKRFGDDTAYIEVEVYGKNSVTWIVTYKGVRKKATNVYPLSRCLEFVKLGLWEEGKVEKKESRFVRRRIIRIEADARELDKSV